MQKKMVKKHLLFFVFGCNMKSNGIVAAQHPKSTRKRRQIKKQQQTDAQITCQAKKIMVFLLIFGELMQ